MAVVTVERVSRRFRRVLALDEVSCEISGGELTVIAGPSGSGKTTLLSVLAGVETVDSGRIGWGPPVRPGRMSWRDVAFVPQSLALLDELTARENVLFPSLVDTGGPAFDVDELMAGLRIEHVADRYPSQASGGEQQRTAIARALLLRPALLVADEPTGHQDRHRAALVLDVLRRHAYAGHAVLLSSHDEAVIAAADRILHLSAGRLTDPPNRQKDPRDPTAEVDPTAQADPTVQVDPTAQADRK